MKFKKLRASYKCISPIYGYQVPGDRPGDRPRLKRIDKKAGETVPPEHQELKLPCRQCIPCRIRHSHQWVVRLMHEAQTNEIPAYFVTLTYNNENVPISLEHRDFQLFMKRLRKKYPDNKIRYFMCGEYGEETYRPHYHVILYGLHLEDIKFFRKNANGDKLYTSQIMTDLWGLGHVAIGYANKSTMAYTAGYMLKEQFRKGMDGSYEYKRIDPETGEIVDVKRPYIRQSTNPGIGKDWLDQNTSDLEKGFLTIEGKTVAIPEYYIRKLEDDHPEIFKKLKEMKEASSTERLKEASEWEAINNESWDLAEDEYAKTTEDLRRRKVAFLNKRRKKL